MAGTISGYNQCMALPDRFIQKPRRPAVGAATRSDPPRSSGPRLLGDLRRVSVLPRLIALFGWLLLVLYPNPLQLGDSITHLRTAREDPAAVAALAARLPDAPRTIERIVLDRIVPYGYDWQVSGVPWHFPTTAEALAAGRGDCESRALVLASILEAKGIPHRLLMSFDHIWVDYPGKVPNAMENAAVAIAGQGEDGGFSLHWPGDFHPWQEIQTQLAIYWAPMPWLLRALLFAGALLILGANGVLRALADRDRRAGRPAPARRHSRSGAAFRPAAGRLAGSVRGWLP